MPGGLQTWEFEGDPADAGESAAARLDGWDGAGPVVWASRPAGLEAKEALIQDLLKALGDVTRPGASRCPGPPVRLETDVQGRPLLFLGDAPGPAVSFSMAGGRVYAALAARGQVGVDVAYPEEFRPPYPFARVFSPGEWELAHRLSRGDARRAAALLWSLKEAALKARGEGFRRLAPGQVTAAAPRPWGTGLLFAVTAGRPVLTWARPEGDGWLAVALVNSAPEGATSAMRRA